MNIPKSYEALAADLASEKIISKTMLGQKEAYMMLADKGGLDLSESKAREAALREELEALRESYASMRDRKNSIVDLQQRLTVAERRVCELESLSVKQAALLDELGIPLDEVDDLFGETLKNARRYEYLRSVMAIENFPGPHPEWSEPSEVDSKRIDDLCDAALKPAAEGEWS